jgi:hypothetical protein
VLKYTSKWPGDGGAPEDFGEIPHQIFGQELEQVGEADKCVLQRLHVVGVVVEQPDQHIKRTPEVRVEFLPEVARQLGQQAAAKSQPLNINLLRYGFDISAALTF